MSPTDGFMLLDLENSEACLVLRDLDSDVSAALSLWPHMHVDFAIGSLSKKTTHLFSCKMMIFSTLKVVRGRQWARFGSDSPMPKSRSIYIEESRPISG